MSNFQLLSDLGLGWSAFSQIDLISKSDFRHLSFGHAQVMFWSHRSQFILMCSSAESPVQVRQESGNGGHQKLYSQL